MCDAIHFSFAIFAAPRLQAMADHEQPKPPWKRQVTPFGPEWMKASCARMEEARAETLEQKRQRDAASAMAAGSSGSGLQTSLPSGESLPPPVAEDMRRFRFVTMTPACFVPQRHLFMCAGRPIVVPCFMYFVGGPLSVVVWGRKTSERLHFLILEQMDDTKFLCSTKSKPSEGYSRFGIRPNAGCRT